MDVRPEEHRDNQATLNRFKALLDTADKSKNSTGWTKFYTTTYGYNDTQLTDERKAALQVEVDLLIDGLGLLFARE